MKIMILLWKSANGKGRENVGRAMLHTRASILYVDRRLCAARERWMEAGNRHVL